jgi:hypothetical protein
MASTVDFPAQIFFLFRITASPFHDLHDMQEYWGRSCHPMGCFSLEDIDGSVVLYSKTFFRRI